MRLRIPFVLAFVALGCFLTAAMPALATQACGPSGCKQIDPPDPIGGGTGICITEYGRICKKDSFGGSPYCPLDKIDSVCQHEATTCGCPSGGGSGGFLMWNIDPIDERSLIYQGSSR